MAVRADYSALIAADRVVDATVVTVGALVGSVVKSFTVDLTVQISRALCGGGAGPVAVRYIGLHPGVYNPAGRPPVQGDHLIMLLGRESQGVSPLLQIFTADQYSRLAALLATPPSLSL